MTDSSAGSEATEPRHSKAELMARINDSRAALEQLVNRLDEDRAVAPGADGWSVKDHLAHVAVWERSLLALLEGRPRHEGMGLDRATYEDGDTDAINAALYAQSHDRPLSEVLADFRATHERLLSVVSGMTDEDLYRPYSHYQPGEPPRNDEPVIGWIAGNTFGHYEEHTDWIRWLVGDDASTARQNG